MKKLARTCTLLPTDHQRADVYTTGAPTSITRSLPATFRQTLQSGYQ